MTNRHTLNWLCLILAGIGCGRPGWSAETVPSGEKIYQTQCAACHGKQGEGSDEYERELHGDLSVAQLAVLIGKTMPLDDPGSLSADESKAVAEYVHGTFYSAVARARTKPPRIELARLTVNQYRRSLTDLVASFREPVSWGEDRGLRASYYRGRRPGADRDRALQRIDAHIDFDFGTQAPLAEITDARRFSIRWEGAVYAPETGHYDFVIRTDNAARLWINDKSTPLIDAWVKSGDDTEYKSRIFLLKGTLYSLRLEFTKANQGVDDSKKDLPPAKASIALLWKRPHGAVEVIPHRHLSPRSAPEAFICTTPFPPDDRSFGWERGTSVSKAWEQATTSGAIEAAGYISDRVHELAGTNDNDPNRAKKIQEFCEKFAECAFRKPLADDQKQFFVSRHFDNVDVETAVKRVVLLVLKSPRFLFREVGEGGAPFDVAARLSFGLWDSLPDPELFLAAAENRLQTKDQVAKQAERMLWDLRAKAKLHHFLLTWLKCDLERELSKDTEVFPGFDETMISDLRVSLEIFLDDVLGSKEADFRRLLLEQDVFVNDRLADFYGAEVAADSGFSKVTLDDGKRAGVLTHPYVMASLADRQHTSPIHRGVLLARGMLGVALRPPPVAVAPLAADLHPGLTTRERVTLQTQPANCMTCHGIINPLGFTLERFDAVGRIRDQDRGKPINDTGSYQTRNGETVTIAGARGLAEMLSASDEVHSAFCEQLFHHLVQQPVRAYGSTTLDDLKKTFTSRGMNIRTLAIEIMASSALVGNAS